MPVDSGSGVAFPVAVIDGELVWASDLAERGMRPPGLSCVGCDRPMSLKAGVRNQPHFAHRAVGVCAGSESVLHRVAKEVIASAIASKSESGGSYLVSWSCPLCEADRVTDLTVGEVVLEGSFGAVRPDVAVVDHDGRPVAVVEVVVTHRPERATSEWFRRHGVAVFEVTPSWETLETLRSGAVCEIAHQDVPPASHEVELFHRDGSVCGDRRVVACRRAFESIRTEFEAARREHRPFWLDWDCVRCGRQVRSDLTRLFGSVGGGHARPGCWQPLEFYEPGGVIGLVVEFDDVELGAAPSGQRVGVVRVPLESDVSFESGFECGRVVGFDGDGDDHFVETHFDGSSCQSKAAFTAARSAFASLLEAARAVGDRLAVTCTCRLCGSSQPLNLASARVASVAVDVDVGGVHADVVLFDGDGAPRVAVQLVSFGRRSLPHPDVPVMSADGVRLPSLLLAIPPQLSSVEHVVVVEAVGFECRSWRHPVDPGPLACACGSPVRVFRFEVGRGANCPGCRQVVPVLDVVESMSGSWQHLVRASDEELRGVAGQVAGSPVVLRMNSTPSKGTYLMHHCPGCGYKIGDYYQYEETSNRRLAAGSEFSIRTLCEAEHWSVLSQAPVPAQPDGLMPRRFQSWFSD